VAVKVTECCDGNVLGATNVAVFAVVCRVPTGALKVQFTATAVPVGPVAVNAWEVPRATTAEPGETVTLGVGVGVAADVTG
jgi:hypothetical protein